MSLSTPGTRHHALDLASDDWVWLYELAIWLAPEKDPPDFRSFVPTAQATLIGLLDEGLIEVATLECYSRGYHTLDSEAARRLISDPSSWRTAEVLNGAGNDVLFAYVATDEGRRVYFGEDPVGVASSA